mgnify:CR=1 FL=1
MNDNIASLTNEAYQYRDRESCGFNGTTEQLFFEMKDNYHTFVVGLKDILMCMEFAIEQGELPTIPLGWWVDVKLRYGIELVTEEEEI